MLKKNSDGDFQPNFNNEKTFIGYFIFEYFCQQSGKLWSIYTWQRWESNLGLSDLLFKFLTLIGTRVADLVLIKLF